MNELSYNRNEVARSLKMRFTNTIGIIAPKLSNVYFMEVIETNGCAFNLSGVHNDHFVFQ